VSDEPGWLASLLASRLGDAATYAPRQFSLTSSSEAEALGAMLERSGVTAIHDTILQQLAGLLETRSPAETYSASDLQRRVAEHLGEVPPWQYGTWVWYPWSCRLVHVLPPAEFAELRTSRNRNKITDEEQATLRRLTVAIAGLSVGQATAITLALEEVGGAFRLADFDHLELSNMNRLRAGVHELGLNKAVLTAREIYEINPYADVTVFTEGVAPENVDAFLDGADILFEECDDLFAKIVLREHARSLRIPVLMETSDRGMIDVERFDLEPDRPIMHGLVGDVVADDVRNLSTNEKVPIVLRILGANSISRRMAASLVDIETSLKTWPQLASAVALGGGLNTDVARRVALGGFAASGRYYVDLEEVVSDSANGRVEIEPTFAVEVSPEARAAVLPIPKPRSRGVSLEAIRALVAHAAMAPSGGNCQPWRFVFRDEKLYCLHDVERSISFLDFEHSASILAIGAAVENITLAAPTIGLEAHVDLFPETELPRAVAAISFAEVATHDEPLLDLVFRRVTNRRLASRVPLSAAETTALTTAATDACANLQLLTGDSELAAVADVLARGDRVRFLSNTMHTELMRELRWTREEVESSRDGIDVSTLELTPTDLVGMRLISSWSMMRVLRNIGAGRGLEKPTRNAIAAASGVGLLTVDGTSLESYFNGGRAMQRVWLAATAHGLAFQPMTALVYVFLRLVRGGGGFSEAERDDLRQLRNDYCGLFETAADRAEVMLFRVARAGPPTARALRRPVDEILSVERGRSTAAQNKELAAGGRDAERR
jgi:molybdopterin/thiamine biosynthesis adenylyltransferase